MKSTECPEFYILFGTLGANQENELGSMSRILYIFRDILALTHLANTLWRNVSVMGVHLSEDMTDLFATRFCEWSRWNRKRNNSTTSPVGSQQSCKKYMIGSAG